MHLLFLCVCDECEDLCMITGVAGKMKKKHVVIKSNFRYLYSSSNLKWAKCIIHFLFLSVGMTIIKENYHKLMELLNLLIQNIDIVLFECTFKTAFTDVLKK